MSQRVTTELIQEGDARFEQYLKVVKPHYANGSQKRGLRTLVGEQQNGCWRFVCLDADLGRFTLLIDGLEYVDGYGIFDEPNPARDLTYTWSLTREEDGWTVDVHHRNFLGISSGRYRFNSLVIEHEVKETAPGACRACGSTRIAFDLSLYFEAEMNGETSCQWDGDGVLGTRPRAHCAICGVEQTQFGTFGRDELTVNGHLIERKIGGKSDVTLQQLFGQRQQKEKM